MKRLSRRRLSALIATSLGLGAPAGSLGQGAIGRTHQGEPATGSPQPGTPGDVLLMLGDSIAAGVGASDPLLRGFGPVLHGYLERLARREIELVNLAIPGETTGSFEAGGQEQEAIRLIAEAHGAGLFVSPIVVSLGANDLLAADRNPAALEAVIPRLAANLAAILEELRAAALDETGQPTADLLAVTYYDPSGSDPARPGSDAWWVSRLNETIARAALDADGRAPDLLPIFRGRETELTWTPSDIHPTNAGHREIANALWAATGYDVVPPTVTLLRPTPGPLPRRHPTIVAQADDTVGIERVSASLGEDPIGDLVFHPEAGAYLLLWDASGLPEGDHELVVQATDAAGNIGRAVVIIRPSGVGVTPVA